MCVREVADKTTPFAFAEKKIHVKPESNVSFGRSLPFVLSHYSLFTCHAGITFYYHLPRQLWVVMKWIAYLRVCDTSCHAPKSYLLRYWTVQTPPPHHQASQKLLQRRLTVYHIVPLQPLSRRGRHTRTQDAVARHDQSRRNIVAESRVRRARFLTRARH